jgi:DNA helicase II / ATP-dependent DNA helicase PcrA
VPSDSRVILASAGSGKTTGIVREAGANSSQRAWLITYTINGRSELSDKAYEIFGSVPSHITITTWYSFVLRHFVRPYQAALHPTRVSTINFKRGQSTRDVAKSQIARYYFSSPARLLLDKVTAFACAVDEKTKGRSVARFAALCDHLFIDEAQDLSGYDLELVEVLLKGGIRVTLIGDCRQATYTTNDSPKNKAFAGAKIRGKFELWEKAGLLKIEHHAHSYRCVQPICDLADALYPDYPATKSENKKSTDHDGPVAVREVDVATYLARFGPQTLRYSKSTGNALGAPLNFGAVKGMTFDRTLIYPHGPLKKYLKSGDLKDIEKSVAKVYVATTRARQSVGFVIANNMSELILPIWEP